MKDTPVLLASDFNVGLLSSVETAKIQKGRRYPKDRE